MKAFPALLVCLFLLSGCSGGGSGTPPPQNADVSGPWQAIATSTANPSAKITVEANLADANGSVSSTAFVVLNSCVQSVSGSGVTGTVSGNNVTLTASYNGVTVMLTGTVAGKTISGTYTASGACGSDSGTWTAQQMPQIIGNYSGSVFSNSNPNQGITVSATVSTDSTFAITGSASIASICFNQMSLSGNQVGGAAEITATDAQGNTVIFLFISNDAVFGSITGTYSVTTGTCSGDAGSGTLTKG